MLNDATLTSGPDEPIVAGAPATSDAVAPRAARTAAGPTAFLNPNLRPSRVRRPGVAEPSWVGIVARRRGLEAKTAIGPVPWRCGRLDDYRVPCMIRLIASLRVAALCMLPRTAEVTVLAPA